MKNIKDKFTFYNTERDNVNRHIKANIWHQTLLSINDPVWHKTYRHIVHPIRYAIKFNEKP